MIRFALLVAALIFSIPVFASGKMEPGIAYPVYDKAPLTQNLPYPENFKFWNQFPLSCVTGRHEVTVDSRVYSRIAPEFGTKEKVVEYRYSKNDKDGHDAPPQLFAVQVYRYWAQNVVGTGEYRTSEFNHVYVHLRSAKGDVAWEDYDLNIPGLNAIFHQTISSISRQYSQQYPDAIKRCTTGTLGDMR